MKSILKGLLWVVLLTIGIPSTLPAQQADLPLQNNASLEPDDTLIANENEPAKALAMPTSNSLIPYRRIYLPSDLLQRAIRDREYSPSDLEQSAVLFKTYETDAETAATYRMAPELEAMFYTAKLAGKNLVSDLSRIQMNRGSYIGERFSLFPLSLHLVPSFKTNAITELNEVNSLFDRFAFDRQGRSSISLHRTDTKLANEKLNIPFGWTLASETSTAQNQTFRAAIPACPNSLLLLALPENLCVHEGNVPVFEVARWLDLQPRLGDWAFDAKQAIDRIATETPNPSIWLLELGGVQNLTFTVSPRSANSSSIVVDPGKPSNELILSQKIEHQISANWVKSKCTLDIPADTVRSSDSDIRIQFDTTSRLVRVSSLNREIDWQVEGGFIHLRKSSLRASSAQRDANTFVEIECLSKALNKDEARISDLMLPGFWVDQSCVLKGTTSIEVAKDVELQRISTSSNGRLLDTTIMKGMTFEWWSKPIEIAIGFGTRQTDSLAKILYRVSGGGASSSVSNTGGSVVGESVEIMARGIFFRPPESDVLIELEPGWTLLEVLQPTTKRNIPFETLSGPTSGADTIVIQKDDLQTVGFDVDFRLVPPSGQLKQDLVFPIGGWMRFSDGPRETLLIAENLGGGWDMPSISSSAWVGIDSLAANEKAFINYAEKSFVWSVAKKEGFVFAKRSFSPFFAVEVETKITRTGEDTIKFEHHFYEDTPLASVRPTFELPAFDWYSKQWGTLNEGDRRISQATTVQPLSPIRMELPFLENASENANGWSIECKLQCGAEGIVIPSPVFPANVKVTRRLRVDSHIEVDLSHSAGRWICDEHGKLVLEMGQDSVIPRVKFRDVSDATTSLERQPRTMVEVAIDANGIGSSKWKILFPTSSSGDGLVRLQKGWCVDIDTLRIGEGADLAWTVPGKEANEFSVFFASIKNSSSEDQSVVIEFEAINEDSFLNAKWGVPRLALPLDIPVLEYNATRLPSSGRLSIPANLSWQIISAIDPDSQSHWSLLSGAPWWIQAKRVLLSEKVHVVDKPSLNGHEKFDHGYWKTSFEWNEKDNNSQVWIAIGTRIRWLSGLLFSISFLGTIWTLPKRAWVIFVFILVLCSVGVTVSAMDSIVQEPISMAIAGCALGIFAASLARVVVAPPKDRTNEIREESVVAWDLFRPATANRHLAQSNQALVKSIFFCVFMVGFHSMGIAQSVQTNRQNIQFDLVFPTEDSSETTSAMVYIPDSLYSSIKGNSPSTYLLNSARHQWRIASRTRSFAVIDQLTSTYELWIGALGTPVEIPVRSNQIRIYVNDLEIAYGARLQRNLSNNTIVWTPEKPGKYKVQVVANLQADSDEDESPVADEPLITQAFDVSILPAGNAILEIDVADPQLQLELSALGGISNPSPGKFVASLGNVDKFKGRLKFPNSGFVSPTRNSSVTEFPTLCTEFLLSETIQARTVIHVPPGASMESTFELEVDDDWQPVGKTWGNIQLVDTQASSSYSRKRYVFVDKSRGLLPNERASQLSILWSVRNPGDVTLNALFADCMDRRIRPSILRYARMPEAAWSIEEVTTWSTMIGERERLDWPELTAINVNPRATSLRIPANGGRGVLKKAIRLSNAQARIATRWTVHSESQSILVRAEVIGALNGDYIEMDLPEGFVVTEARRRQGSFVVLQCQQNENGRSTNRVQLLLDRLQTDRLQWKDFDFSIRAERAGVDTQKQIQPPTMVLHNMNTVEQSIELAASDQWQINLLNQEEPVFGAGMNTTLLTMTPEQRITFDRRVPPYSGPIEHHFLSQPDSDKVQLAINGFFEIRGNTSTRFIVEIPVWLEEYWNCDRSAALIPCPLADKAWLQIDLGAPGSELERRAWSVQFSLIRDELILLQSDASSIRVLDSRLQSLPFSLEFEERHFPQATEESIATRQKTAAYFWTEISSNPERRTDVLRYWFDEWSPSLQWQIESKERVAMVRVQDAIVPWNWNDGILSASIPRQASGWLYEVTIVLNPIDVKGMTPNLQSNTMVSSLPKPVALVENREMALSVVLDRLEEKLDLLPVDLPNNSYAERWLSYWGQKFFELRTLTNPSDESLQRRSTELVDRLAMHKLDLAHNREQMDPMLGDTPSEHGSTMRLDWLYGLQTGVFLFATLAVYGRWRTRPWWLLICLAVLFWLMTGWFILPGILIVSAAISAADTYWIRRTSKTLTRSQRLRPN